MISYDPVVITDLEIPAVAEMFCKGTVFAYNIGVDLGTALFNKQFKQCLSYVCTSHYQ